MEKLRLNGEWLKWVIVGLVGGIGGGGTSLLREDTRLVAKAVAADLLIEVNRVNADTLKEITLQLSNMHSNMYNNVQERIAEQRDSISRLSINLAERGERLSALEASQTMMLVQTQEIRASVLKILDLMAQHTTKEKP